MLEILKQFIGLMASVMTPETGEAAVSQMATGIMSFATPEVGFLEQMALALLVMLGLTNAFAIVASEGASIAKISFYIAVMSLMTGLAMLAVPPVVQGIF